MQLQTEVGITGLDFKISHRDFILILGSCFAENISCKLERAGFRVDTNPFGILYNPASVAGGIKELLNKKIYSQSDVFEYRGLFHSFSHHSRFSATSSDDCVRNINDRIKKSSEFLGKASVLFITFGTSNIYLLRSDNRVVSNCHQLPSGQFIQKGLSVEDILFEWTLLVDELTKMNPGLKIVFTVSPVRHWKDGAHENQLSKSKLLIAIDQLVKMSGYCYYFPSYEIMMDELRDYRFYADDMLHPSEPAVNYIWERFSSVFFDKNTVKLAKEWEDVQRALNHKPFHPDSEDYKLFRKQAEQKLEELKKVTFNYETTFGVSQLRG